MNTDQVTNMEVSENDLTGVSGGHLYTITNIKILTTPRGEPVPYMNRNGKDVCFEPQFVKDLGQKIQELKS